MARKSRKNMMLLEATALPDKEKKVLFKAGLYARLSHETEENIERGTIETQMELMKNYVKDHEDIVIEEEYYDASFTGTNFERPDFQRMLEDAKTGRINCIIVKDLSRLGRNYVEMGNYIERVFPFLNVRFIAVTDDFDSFRPGTDLMMPLKNIVNEFYAKDISKKVSTAHRRKWTTDEYMCGFAPYGYLKSKTEKNRIVVDEATAGNVRLIYKLFLEGKGYTPIAKYLNEQGIMSPLMYLKSLGYQLNVKTNGVWTKTTVKSILTNQAYIGSAVHGKVVIEKYNNIPLHATDPSEWVIVKNTYEPLVDKEPFEKAQERVKKISDAYFAKEFTKHPPNEKNLLKGKIVCGDCGKGMRLSPRTKKSYVYFCGTFSDGINPACSRHKIDQEDVNKAVFAQISNHMRCCIDALRVIRELNARSSGLKKYDVYEKAITRQRRELEKVNRKFSELYGDYSEHLINESEYLTLKQQYLLKSEALKKEIDNLLVSQNLYSKNYKIDEDWENLINKYLKCRKLNKELADAFVDKVQVFEDGRISVNLVYDDCLEELLQVKNKREGDLYE
uniref:recombinase family protein n=1 Tax=Lachnospira eligens TaxID=39485 RepID=UPI00402792EF